MGNLKQKKLYLKEHVLALKMNGKMDQESVNPVILVVNHAMELELINVNLVMKIKKDNKIHNLVNVYA